MSNVYNTPFELSLRTLLVLEAASETPKTLDEIVSLDFVAAYGKHFGIAEQNLHGNNELMFSEITMRRELMDDAVRHLVLKGLVTVGSSEDGFTYCINTRGNNYCKSFRSSYSDEYRRAVTHAHDLFLGKSGREISKLISQYALEFSNESSE